MEHPLFLDLTARGQQSRLPRPYSRNRNRQDAGPAQIGSKAQGLAKLIEWGFRVPATYVCTWAAYERHCAGDGDLAPALRNALRSLDLSRAYAVRSSANLEDGIRHSFAGQFQSVLDLRGEEALWQAVLQVWDSARRPGVKAYLSRLGRPDAELKMAVIVQELVPPVVSGVAFSRNPMTGMDEVVVEAVAGSGELLVQEGITPHRWIHKWGSWRVRPPTDEISPGIVEDVVAGTHAIARAFGQPVDLEWVYDGEAVHWVQMRAITSLTGGDLYSNRIAREVLPGQIKPLVWSVNVPLVNSAWVRLFTELIGPNDIDLHSLARAFYYRAYFNMGAIGEIFAALGMPRDSLELLMGIEVPDGVKPSFRPTVKMLAHLPRMIRFLAAKLRFHRQVETFLPAATARFDAFSRLDPGPLDPPALLAQIDGLYGQAQETAYFNIVVPLLMQLYNRLLDRELVRAGLEPTSIDITRDLEALRDLNPNGFLLQLGRRFHALAPADQAEVRRGFAGGGVGSPPAADFLQELDRFTRRFGHLSDSGNDFSAVPWRERPGLMFELATAVPPAVPQEGRRGKGFYEVKLPFWRRPMAGWLYGRARRFRLYREQISSLYTFGYGLFRNYFLALGERLVRDQVLTDAEDIFFLYMEEVRQIVGGLPLEDAGARVRRRRREMADFADVSLPSVIYGDVAPPIQGAADRTLDGTATARGYYQGPVRVVRGLGDFDRVRQGDVLVIPFSDVGWSPLFAKAGAVIAESGGMLSHTSIVAREYNIPAVVSVADACRLPDGVLVTVDGYGGNITIHTQEEG